MPAPGTDEGLLHICVEHREEGGEGDLVVFTDDDAIPPTNWLKRWQALCRASGNLAGLSSRDIYIDLGSMELRKTQDDQPLTKLYRWLVGPWRER